MINHTAPSLWRHGEFMKFWTGQTISVFGSAITGLALPLTAVLTLNAGAGQMGVLNAAGTLPFLLVGLFAGVAADRMRRRPILLAADICRAGLLALIPLAVAFGALRIELLYAVVFLVGVASVFFDVSYQAFLPALVGREHLVEGNAKLEISFSAAQIAGPGLAGALVRLLTAPFALVVDAASFLVSAFSLALIRTPETPPQPSAATPNIWREIREGLQVVFSNRMLWAIAGSTATSNLFAGVWNAVYVLYLTKDLQITPEVMGVIFAAGAPGALIAAVIAERLTARLGLGRTIVGSSLLGGLAPLLIPLASGPTLTAAVILSAAGFFMGLGTVLYNVNQVSLRQAITPGRLLGRMNASMRFLVWGTIPLGSLLGGAIGQAFGVRTALLIGVGGQLLAVLWVYFSPVRGLRTQPEPHQDAPAQG